MEGNATAYLIKTGKYFANGIMAMCLVMEIISVWPHPVRDELLALPVVLSGLMSRGCRYSIQGDLNSRASLTLATRGQVFILGFLGRSSGGILPHVRGSLPGGTAIAYNQASNGRVGSGQGTEGFVVIGKLTEVWNSDPLKALALAAALIALATTPIAFAILGRLDWFQARRGRVLMKPSFISIIVGMMLVMSIPAIFAALVVKSQDFDKDRYEFDPNKTWSVLDQGRAYKTLDAADNAVKLEMERLAEERKNLANGVKKLDEAMVAMRTASAQSMATAQAVPAVLERLATIRRAVGVDAPQQLMDFTVPAVTGPIAGTGNAAGAMSPSIASATGSTFSPNATGTAASAPTAIPVPPKSGLTEAEANAEYATVAEPQRNLASMLPLAGIPAGWEVSKSGDKHLEAFNADNMFEKIDGRAESFTQNNVTGMAYASYHPTGDDSSDVQIYIFEFDHSKPLRAQTKYNTEKPDDLKPIAIGTEGYTAAGSLLFFTDPYYTQIVSTVDDPKFAKFAEEIARRVAAKQKPTGNQPKSAAESIFALLPAEPARENPTLVALDAFGYGFLSEIFMADYKEGNASWQGFIRPYATVAEAESVFTQYLAAAKRDGGDAKLTTTPGADQFVINTNVGLVDAIFRRGATIGGVSGASGKTDADKAEAASRAEAFARKFAQDLPAEVPVMKSDPAKVAPQPKPAAEAGGGEGAAGEN